MSTVEASSFIGVVCGLQSEAKAVRTALDGEAVRIGVSGADAARAEVIAQGFCRQGARAILSVGVSGGLDPALRPGDLIISDQVALDGGELLGSIRPITIDADKFPGAGLQSRAVIFGSDIIIGSAQQKARLYEETGAIAVDMESHGAARAAFAGGVPFLAIRAIADPAERALPSAAMEAVAPDGSTRVMKTLLACIKAPAQFPALIKLGADSDRALKTLRTNLGPLVKAVLQLA